MNTLKISTREAVLNTDLSVVEAEGHLDIHTVEHFEEVLSGLFKRQQYKIILDFGNLAYISSAGIGVLISVIKDVRQKGGDMKFVSPHQDVYRTFELLELPSLFQFFKTEFEAVAQFSKPFSLSDFPLYYP